MRRYSDLVGKETATRERERYAIEPWMEDVISWHRKGLSWEQIIEEVAKRYPEKPIGPVVRFLDRIWSV